MPTPYCRPRLRRHRHPVTGAVAQPLERRVLLASAELVKDINPGIKSGFHDEYPQPLDPHFTTVGNTTFFVADDGTRGAELWKTDGTAAGTVLVADVRPGAQSSALRELTALGNVLLFAADSGSGGSELWRSDGTSAGTV